MSETKPKPKNSRYTLLIELLCLLFVVATVLVVRETLYEPVHVPTDSMAPTIAVGDRLIVHKRAYVKETPERGDIVMFTWPDHPEARVVKRIVGLPGEFVMTLSGHVRINGRRLREPYVKQRTIRERPYGARLREGEYWMLGDNRNHSEDSRDEGPLPRGQIIGKVTYRYWPLARRGPLREAETS